MSRRTRYDFDLSSTRTSRGQAACRRLPAGTNLFHRRLRIEPLEDRRLLATVDTLIDVVNDDDDGFTSLREAILAAFPGETIDFDASLFSSGPATIELTNVDHPGEILINKSLTIQGPGANLLTIKAFDPDANGTSDGDGSRVFYINAPGLANVTISGVTLTNGDVNSSGGAIASSENLTVRNSIITDNFAGHASSRGGGIAHFFGTLTLERTTISDNVAVVSGGGVVADHATAVHLIDSTISGNQAASGGGIYGYYSYNMNVVGSTISGNRATLAGGGIGLFYGSLSARHSTITANRGDSDDNGLGGGGGAVVGSSSTLGLFHTIVAGNFRGAGAIRSDIFGAVTASFSLIGDNTNAFVTNVGGTSLVGSGAMPIDAMLGPLASNGGRTRTHALLAGSPAIDSGQVGIASPPANDQRGAPFVRIFDGDGAGGARIDMGAYERQTLAASSFVVDTLVDEDDGDYSAGDRSLRDVISLAHGSSGAETITFAAALTSGPGTILLTQGELAIRDSLTINGPGANLLTIDASGNDPTPGVDNGDGSRVFDVSNAVDGMDNGLMDVAISGFTLTGGDAAFNGGAIRTLENLTIASSVISGNSATSRGGGIYNASGTLMLLSSTVQQNVANFGGGVANYNGDAVVHRSTISSNRGLETFAGEGGGIHTHGGNLTVTSSTISGNIAEDGGGIHSYTNLTGTQTTTIINSTISGNVVLADAEGGGIYNDHGLTIIRHSTITNNTAPAGFGSGVLSKADGTARTEVYSSIIAGNTNSDVDFVEGFDNSFQSFGYNVVGTGNALADFNQAGDQTGVTNPMLGPLAPNGGLTQTHALLAGSPALDSGDLGVPSPPANDQRGAPFVRIFDGDGAGGARIDIGATERQTLAGLNLLVDQALDENDGNYSVGDLSLREAIGLANGSPGANTITFDPALYSIKIAKIFLTQGELVINDSLTINGPGSDNLLIDASRVDPTPYVRSEDGIRVFFVRDRTSFVPIDVALIGMSIRGADVEGSGGAIHNSGENLTVTNCEIEFNHADNGGAIFSSNGTLILSGSKVSGNSAGNNGGGVYLYEARPSSITDTTISENIADAKGGGVVHSFSDTLTITRATISGNQADNGGGIYGGDVVINDSAITGNSATSSGGGIRATDPLAINRSTISGNSAVIGGGIRSDAAVTITDSTLSENVAQYGGGIFQDTYDLTITSSTLSGNDASQAGGGVLSATSGSFKTTILNSTFADNTAATLGGAIFNSSGRVDIRHSTITAPNTFNLGGGVASRGNNGTETRVFSSIIASNHGPDVQFFDGTTNSFASQAYNLVGFGNATPAFTNFGDQVGVDPMLAFLLEDHGGPTKTFVPLPGSPVIDAGPPSNTLGLPFFDQRGFPFIRAFNGDGMPGSQVDIGAFEVQTVANLSLVVDTLVDEYDGNFSAGDFSLREAIGLANGSTGPNTITFAPALTSGGPATILLTRGELQIVETLTITGPGASLLSIDASGNDPTPAENIGDGSRIFSVDDTNAEVTSIVFTLNGLTLTGADEHTIGGAIDSNKTVVVNNCIITGNSAADGGGINVDEGTVTLNNSMVVGNHARDDGGGIFEDDGTTFINSSMIQGNTAVDRGGGIANIEKVVITASTISGNSAAVGGGIFSQTNLLGNEYTTITNSTISGNTATDRGGGIYSIEGILSIRFSTITDNSAPAGMGSGVASHGTGDTRTEVHSSIIAANDASDVDFVNGGANSFDSEGYNLIGAGNATMSPLNAFNQTGDQVGANPMLGPLATNGGPTMTHVLLVGSPAIDSGDPAAMAGVAGVPQFDQRGTSFSRVFNGDNTGGARIDKGALELQPVVPALTGDYNLNGTVDAADYVVWRDTLSSSVAPFSGADGDGDGAVDQDDYGVWKTHFGDTLGPGSGAAFTIVVAQPATFDAQTVLTDLIVQRDPSAEQISASAHRGQPDDVADPREPIATLTTLFSVLRTAPRAAARPLLSAEPATANRRDAQLMAWLASQPETQRQLDAVEPNAMWSDEETGTMSDSQLDSIDHVFALLPSG